MTDHFAALGLPRRPWLDEEAVKEAFHQRSANVHPDRVHQADAATRRAAEENYAALNAAQQCLRKPRERLAHLIQLERGHKPGDCRDLPPSVMGLFAEVGAALRETEAARREKQAAASAVARARVMAAALPQMTRLEALQSRLRDHRDSLLAEARQLDAGWPTDDIPPSAAQLDAVERLYHQLGFVDRWLAQLRERVVQLTL
ncbi:MAG: DnaJ domain-containing protein [Limisphaerales bacterium]